MVAYNFMARFAPLVESGQKTQTIRVDRHNGRHASIGSQLQLYTGMRTQNCRLLCDAVCLLVRPITIKDGGVYLGTFGFESETWLTQTQIQRLAIADGFDSADDFFEFFPNTEDDRILIAWGPLDWLT